MDENPSKLFLTVKGFLRGLNMFLVELGQTIESAEQFAARLKTFICRLLKYSGEILSAFAAFAEKLKDSAVKLLIITILVLLTYRHCLEILADIIKKLPH